MDEKNNKNKRNVFKYDLNVDSDGADRTITGIGLELFQARS